MPLPPLRVLLPGLVVLLGTTALSIAAMVEFWSTDRQIRDAAKEVERVRTTRSSLVLDDLAGDRIVGLFPVGLTPPAGDIVASSHGVAAIAYELTARRIEAHAEMGRRLAGLAGAVVITGFIAWLLLDRLLLRRLDVLVEAADQLHDGRPPPWVEIHGADEVARLAPSFQRMSSHLAERAAALDASNRFVTAALDAVPAHVAVLDEHGVIISVNRAWRDFGDANGLADAHHCVGRRYAEVCEAAFGSDPGGAPEAVAAAIRDGLAGRLDEFRIEYACHSERWFDLRLVRFVADGATRLLFAHQNVTDVKLTTRALHQGEARFRTLYDNNPAMFFTIDGGGRIVSANDFGARELGYEVDALVGRAAVDLYPQEDHATIRSHLQRCLYDRSDMHRWEIAKVRRDGTRLWARETGRAVIGADDEPAVLEVLLRMRTRAGELVSPGAFLPAAERYSLASRLDRWVVDTMLDWLSAHPSHVERLELCSINVSARSLADNELLAYLERRLEAGAVPPAKLCFEITETAAIGNLGRALSFLGRLSDLGCRFALDDFGSGMSSFAYLKQLPVHYLKIDGVFVRDMIDDAIEAAMVASINDIGHVVGKRTIAEFVESEAINDRLRRIGVDYAQGYGIPAPRPLEELA